MSKERLDVLLAERGLAESREQAQRLILAGQVYSGGHMLEKPGHRFDKEIPIDIKQTARFVSRGGDKLEAAFEFFGLNVEGFVCLDVGASTGGFTDCMLQHGAAKVYSVDVGKGQIHWKIRNDGRVVVMDGVNARYMRKADIPEEIDFCVVDVSFISLTKILPAVIEVVRSGGELVTLVKPQFEAGREQVEKGGVIRDVKVREEVLSRIKTFGTDELKLSVVNDHESPVVGPAGNIEHLVFWKKIK